MAEELYKISDLEDVLHSERIEYSRRPVENSYTPHEHYSTLPILLQDNIIIRLSSQGDMYSHAIIETPDYDQEGFLDAIAKKIAEDKGVHLGKGFRDSKFFSKPSQPIHYFFLNEKSPDKVVQAVHTINSANEAYLKGKNEHDKFITNFLRGYDTCM